MCSIQLAALGFFLLLVIPFFWLLSLTNQELEFANVVDPELPLEFMKSQHSSSHMAKVHTILAKQQEHLGRIRLKNSKPGVLPFWRRMRMSVDPYSTVRVRILLFRHTQFSIRFRKGPTKGISDKFLNICMDGFKRSPHFDFQGTKFIPDAPDQFLEEDQDIIWVVGMRRMIEQHSVSIPEQMVQLVRGTLDYQNETIAGQKKNLLSRWSLWIIVTGPTHFAHKREEKE